MSDAALLDPNVIRQRMASCREEMAALRKLLRLALAARAAEEAKARRQSPSGPVEKEAAHAN
jgi:hypothetical protein